MEPGRAAIRTDSIELAAFLKWVGRAATGGQAKLLVRSGRVRVNGMVETRRGRKLYPGDRVEITGEAAWVLVREGT